MLFYPGILSFTTVPSFNYTPVKGYFSRTDEEFYYRYDDGSDGYDIDFDMKKISDNKFNIYEEFNRYGSKDDFLGKTIRPDHYYLNFYKDFGDNGIFYGESFTAPPGLPDLKIPETWPQ